MTIDFIGDKPSKSTLKYAILTRVFLEFWLYDQFYYNYVDMHDLCIYFTSC